jgi:hypothetical protein
MFQTVARFLARLTPERHRAVRAHFAGLFTPRRVERYRERIVAHADALLDALPATRPVDLVTAFTRPLPFAVIAEVLGVPVDRHEWLSAAMQTFGRAVLTSPARPIRISRSPREPISVWARRWPGCTPKSRCRRCFAAYRACGWSVHPCGWDRHRSARSRRCRSSGPEEISHATATALTFARRDPSADRIASIRGPAATRSAKRTRSSADRSNRR